MAMARSGVSSSRRPSICERNATPPSVSLERAARLKTWNPPESVRIGPYQPMKPWRPPIRATTSSPGRSAR